MDQEKAQLQDAKDKLREMEEYYEEHKDEMSKEERLAMEADIDELRKEVESREKRVDDCAARLRQLTIQLEEKHRDMGMACTLDGTALADPADLARQQTTP